MCLLDLFGGLGRGWEAVEIACTFLGRLLLGLLLGSSNAKKEDDHPKKKLFINNSIEDLTPFKEEHQCLLKLHVLFLGGEEAGVQCRGGGMELSPKREFHLKRKNGV